MNDRVVTAAGALAALLLVFGLFYQPETEPTVSKPTTIETGPNGYLGLARWLASQHVSVVSFQERLTNLFDANIAASGNLLITTMPHELPIEVEELSVLKDWIGVGNTLVVMAALDDTPDWSLLNETDAFLDDVEGLSDTRFEAATDDEDEPILIGEFNATTVMTLLPSLEHPLMDGVVSLAGVTDSVASVWIAAEDSIVAGVAFAREATTNTDAAWEIPVLNGRIIFMATGTLLSNRALGSADNRRFVANLVRWHVAPGGAVIFDDMHQGLSILYDPDAFYQDSRVGVTLLFILAFWFVYMVGTQNRMTPIVQRSVEPQQGDFVTAVGGFMARKLNPVDAGLLLFDNWFSEIRARTGLGANQLPWRQLVANPTVDPELVATLESTHERLREGGKVDLAKLHNAIQHLREAMG